MKNYQHFDETRKTVVKAFDKEKKKETVQPSDVSVDVRIVRLYHCQLRGKNN
jgi:hypothetical protein